MSAVAGQGRQLQAVPHSTRQPRVSCEGISLAVAAALPLFAMLTLASHMDAVLCCRLLPRRLSRHDVGALLLSCDCWHDGVTEKHTRIRM